MKTTILALILLAGCKQMGKRLGADDAAVAVRTTGGICTALKAGGRLTGEVACVSAGKRYLCVVAGERAECALTHSTPAEKP